MTTIAEFLDGYVPAMHELNVAVFAGAGLSIPAGFVNWKDLMRSIATDVGLDVEKEHDLIAVAQYHANSRGGRSTLNALLLNQFASRGQVTENHRILARLPIQTYWTTNYDGVIEGALREAGKKADVKVSETTLANTLSRRDAVVYKMHGDASDPANAVVTKDDYETYLATSRGELFATALKGDLVTKTFLFLGFSFDDPNMSYVLSRIRVLLGTNRRDHYSLMRRVQRIDFQSDAEYAYAKTKQDLQVEDLKRYGILAVLLDHYSEYTDVLRQLERRYKTKQVFISGSADTYEPFSDLAGGSAFLIGLGKALAREGMNVVTGFGFGVGPHIINGVLGELETQGTRTINDRLIMRPFPYGTISDKEERERRWTAYRQQMLSEAGVAVFVFGNKKDSSGETVEANGVVEEFEIAKSLRLLLVPVGATGWTAKTLYKRVAADLGAHYPGVSGLDAAFRALDQPGSPEEIADRIISFIKLLGSG